MGTSFFFLDCSFVSVRAHATKEALSTDEDRLTSIFVVTNHIRPMLEIWVIVCRLLMSFTASLDAMSLCCRTEGKETRNEPHRSLFVADDYLNSQAMVMSYFSVDMG